MLLHVLGSSGSYSLPGRPGSGFLVEHGGTRVWCDTGPGTYPALADTVDPALVDAVLVSHQHPDHCLDLLAVLHRWAFGEPGREAVPLLAPASVIERMVAFLQAGPDHVFFRVFSPVTVEGGETRRIGELEVQLFSTDHSVPTVGSRWTGGGRSIAYSADTGPGGEWRDMARGADLFLCEASLEVDGEGAGHLTPRQAGEIARAQGAASLVLTHLRPHVDPLHSLASAEEAFDRPVSLAVPGTRHEL